MKKLFIAMVAAIGLLAVGCSKYDDTELKGRVDNLETRVTKLEELCKQMNTNISSMQTLVTALQNNDFVTGVADVKEGGVVVGYIITFSKSAPITIYHGKDGANGKDGKDGAAGKDGYTPQIGVKQDTDGIYYWTLDGNWLTDTGGNKIKAEGRDGQNGNNGKDGVTPQLKIENDYWSISYDSGQTWQPLGKATGENGADGNDGDSFFRSVDTSEADYVTFTLADGTEIKLPRHSLLAIAFDVDDLVAMHPNATREIGYTVTGNTENLVVEALSSGDVEALVNDPSAAVGTLSVTTGSAINKYSRVVVLVSNGEKTIMSSLSFEEAGLRVTNGTVYNVSAAGGSVDVTVYTNAEYNVSIPAEAESWISHTGTRAWRNETLTLQVAANESEARTATIELTNEDGVPYECVLIRQAKAIPEDMELAFPDPIFRQYVLDNFDTDKDDKISPEEAFAVDSIDVGSKGIASLEGVQYFINLTYLMCYSNQLTTLDVSQNTALTEFSCWSNKLTTLDVSKNTELTALYCGTNQLTTLDVSQNTALTELYCYENQLKTLDVSKNTELTTLHCYSNQLTTLVLQNTALTNLRCHENQLKTLDVSQSTALTRLDCYSNQLTTLDVSKNTELTILYAMNNQLKTLDVSKNTALTDFFCYSNQLTTLDVSKNTELTCLHCYSNQLTTLDVSKTNLGNSTNDRPLDCAPMPTLKTLTLKKGWSIKDITEDNGRSESRIPKTTQIIFVE